MKVSDPTFQKLKQIRQNHVLEHWNELTPSEREVLSEQVLSIDSTIFLQQRKLISKQKNLKSESFQPFTNFSLSGNPTWEATGQASLRQGKMGCLLIAGGQGSRLGFSGPKGIYPISVVRGKSLFQLFAERVVKASEYFQMDLPLAVMTSPQNHEETLQHFESQKYFGLKKSQISFFQQKTLPILDQEGNLFLEKPWKISFGPNGNGGSLQEFYSSGIWEKWWDQGVRYLNFILVDNALANPFDSHLLGAHILQGHDVTIKCTPRRTIGEKVGLLVSNKEKVQVLEYSELPQSEAKAHNKDGTLKHLCANLSLFCFNMDMIQKLYGEMKLTMPLHLAYKKSYRWDSSSQSSVWSTEENAYKFESFIFDVLPYFKRPGAVLFPRNACFAPLKELKGPYGAAKVRKALLERDRKLYENISGLGVPPERVFELDPAFYYPSREMQKKWKGVALPLKSYIEA